MFGGKKTKLFWCGIFIIILGAYLLIGSVYSDIRNYQINQNNLAFYAEHGTPVATDSAAYLTALAIWVTWAIVYIVLYSALVGIGVYVAKMGIKPPETQTVAIGLTEPALAK